MRRLLGRGMGIWSTSVLKDTDLQGEPWLEGECDRLLTVSAERLMGDGGRLGGGWWCVTEGAEARRMRGVLTLTW